MLGDDLVDISTVFIAIPNPFRVNHEHRPELTTIEAACLVNARAADAGQPQFLNLTFAVVAQLLRAAIVT